AEPIPLSARAAAARSCPLHVQIRQAPPRAWLPPRRLAALSRLCVGTRLHGRAVGEEPFRKGMAGSRLAEPSPAGITRYSCRARAFHRVVAAMKSLQVLVL